jgi:hypothetical protein
MQTLLGRLLIFIGVVFIVAGIVLTFNIHIPWLGRLPGDIHIRRENFQMYFPITTSLLLSVILSLLFYFFRGR